VGDWHLLALPIRPRQSADQVCGKQLPSVPGANAPENREWDYGVSHKPVSGQRDEMLKSAQIAPAFTEGTGVIGTCRDLLP
jgi:hypothetical protein